MDLLFIKWMIGRELDENSLAAISEKKIPELCALRKRLHFGALYYWEYTALEAAYQILSAISYRPEKELPELIKAYCEKDYRIDTAYRNFLYAFDQRENTEQFEKLKDQVENIYITEYLEKIVYAWNMAYQKNAMHRVIPMQSHFYQENVEKVKASILQVCLDSGAKKSASADYFCRGAGDRSGGFDWELSVDFL